MLGLHSFSFGVGNNWFGFRLDIVYGICFDFVGLAIIGLAWVSFFVFGVGNSGFCTVLLCMYTQRTHGQPATA